jgi:hypothetical protein
MADTTTLYSAEETLDRMAEIVRAEMTVRLSYVGSIVRPDLAESGAICGGRQHCAIGALWVAHGVPYLRDADDDDVDLPGVAQSERLDFLDRDPELALAHDALGAAADAFAERSGRRPISVDLGYPGLSYAYPPESAPSYRYGFSSVSKIEALFEGMIDLSKDDLLGVVLDARERVAAMRASS